MQKHCRLLAAVLVVCTFSAVSLSQSESDEEYKAKRHKAVQLFNENKELEALPLFEELMARDPGDADLLLGLAAALVSHSATVDDTQAARDRVRARELLLRAKELGNQSTLLQNLLQMLPADGKVNYSQEPGDQAMRAGEAAFARRDFPAAIAAYSQALQLQPTNYSAALYIGDSYFGAKDFDKAAEWYGRAIKIDPNRETAYRYYADMLTKQGRMEEARHKAIEAIIAEPYNPIPWRGIEQWAKVNNVELQKPHINVPNTVSQGSDENIHITLDPAWPEEVSAVWLAYSLAKANWRGEEFKKHFPSEKHYRHSLNEEADCLNLAATVWHETKDSRKGKNASQSPQDPDLLFLLKVYQAGMVEPYVLFNAADEDIAADYPGYREKNRSRLEEYLATFIVPPAQKP